MMAVRKYSIGIDYGSLCCRAVLADTSTGALAAVSEYVYPHGVIEKKLPDGTVLPPLWALQDPCDYEAALYAVIKGLLKDSKVAPKDIVAVGVDSTASTVIPVDGKLRPLCMDKKFSKEPHAWPKMWKHHAAENEAEELTKAAVSARLPVISKYGGAINSESLLPKVMQVCLEAPEIYKSAETFIELGDWISSLLVGKEVRSASFLSCKSMWDVDFGYPSKDFFAGISPIFAELPGEKLAYHGKSLPVIAWPGEFVGTICPAMASRLGLSEKTVVTAPQMDAYSGLPGSGISDSGTLMMIIGTSTGYTILDKASKTVPGICCSMENANLPGFINYAAGQSGVGDIFHWYVENCVPTEYLQKASVAGVNMHDYLSVLAKGCPPGGCGLLALDWWNGNKSVLTNSNLSGLILGMDLATKPEHIYRALLESTAYGARKIIENFRVNGIGIREIVACGGIAEKNSLLMQIYADVLGEKIWVSRNKQAAAVGAAIYAAAAAGKEKSGCGSVSEAVKAMAKGKRTCFEPDVKAHELYNGLYAEYKKLHDYFGCGGNEVMGYLKYLKQFADRRSI